jgi:hypothetical protein
MRRADPCAGGSSGGSSGGSGAGSGAGSGPSGGASGSGSSSDSRSATNAYSSQNADNDRKTSSSVYHKPSSQLLTHAVLACLSFGFLFPFAAVLMRTLHIPGLVWIHGGFQTLTAFLFTIAFVLGIMMAKDLEYVSCPNTFAALKLTTLFR